MSYDYFGDYDVALLVAACCFVISAFSYLAMGRYPRFGLVPVPADTVAINTSPRAEPST
ncbi:hypothetical protein D3C76_1762190 [compost metagenome]